MDSQQLLATLIQLSDEQKRRIAELLERLEQQARTLTTASQRAEHAAPLLRAQSVCDNAKLHRPSAARQRNSDYNDCRRAARSPSAKAR